MSRAGPTRPARGAPRLALALGGDKAKLISRRLGRGRPAASLRLRTTPANAAFGHPGSVFDPGRARQPRILLSPARFLADCAAKSYKFIMRRLALAVATVAWQAACLIPGAQAQDDVVQCDAFYRNSDGSWTATQSVFLPGTKMVSRVGGVFRRGVLVDGHDVAAALDKACPNPATSPPAAAQTQPPRASLSKFADANGTIDVTRLTCADLADTSDEEADLLLAWYGYPSNGPAKRRFFNMAHLRSAMHGVVDYCKTHRDQNLVRVMDLMSK